ncbi:MAG: hypothetical protein CFH01_00158 [Alphaproteobacteria bacterium MarineAlpha2_Bin1]|nr:MAG: hypothetical protein CFH01_00158 [Alphaproteobacteria bacterium MarineAlpha2_Bin1]|tara:strand:- start:26 stop:850 length:825 start_codon:yes stop_codon:yes gene_type:complete
MPIKIEKLNSDSILVYNYLKLMENRKIEQAKNMLSNDFRMIFPGSMKFQYLDELIYYGKKRQISVFKTFESFEEVKKISSKIIYVRGKLFGRTLNNKKFHDIRYIDKFILLNEKFVRQEVWNDYAIHNQMDNNYPVPEIDETSFKTNQIDLPINSEVLEFIYSLDLREYNLRFSTLDKKFTATLPGKKLITSKDFGKYLDKQKKSRKRMISEIHLIENNKFQVIFLNGWVSGIDYERKKYKNIRFIERIKFDNISTKIESYEIWDDLADHGFKF